ncbi:MAG: translation elongation factor Ts [Deltaproteobacteria bacterium]|nr:translation elongation factor Ts [Deltaproteobacteria bacterium]
MAEIKASDVKELRERTGAGMLDCKNVLTEAGGDMEKAVELLKKKGLAAAAKKAGRTASEGAVASYIHMGGKIGVLIEVNCETDFVAKTEEFQTFCRDLAMHIAAMSPMCVREEEIDPVYIAKQKEIFIAQLKEDPKNSKKPANVLEEIVKGKVAKHLTEVVLLEQAHVKADVYGKDKKIKDILAEKVAKIGENIVIRRFSRFQLGEGLEKKVSNLAEEVAAQVAASQKN